MKHVQMRLLLLCVLVASSGWTGTALEDGGSFSEVEDGFTFAGDGDYSGSGSGSGMLSINITDLILPVCMDDELLSFDGGDLLCIKIPERKCVCPSPVDGSGELPTLPPEPPGGCTVFNPPEGGAFTCLSTPNMIYCSVYCDSTHEFSTTPLNPYFCGAETKFEWMDFTRVTHSQLPECTGFRHSLRPLHPRQFYLAAACDVIVEDQADVDKIKANFCELITFFTRRDCKLESVFVQCTNRVSTTTASSPPAEDPQLNP